MRLLALSDIHVDYQENMAWIEALSKTAYSQDVLLLAGDVSHELERFERALSLLRERFAEVFFVPGNHDLWIVKSPYSDSIEKFHDLLERCVKLGVKTRPEKVGRGEKSVWVLPLYSWYVMPEEGEDSLYMHKRGEDPSLESWADSHFIRWPNFAEAEHAAGYFSQLNEAHLDRDFDAPVVSMSHFLPRLDLIMNTPEENAEKGKVPDLNRSFNFSRVAGSKTLERQIRQAGSTVHVYGHQHRNRYRQVDGILYVSHCLGYKQERAAGLIQELDDEPRVVWETP